MRNLECLQERVGLRGKAEHDCAGIARDDLANGLGAPVVEMGSRWWEHLRGFTSPKAQRTLSLS